LEEKQVLLKKKDNFELKLKLKDELLNKEKH
jgi:hypothetical protein